MSRLILIRHGQASFGSEDYDLLSPLGEQQAFWLGEYFSETRVWPTRIITGGMKRHLQTAGGISQGFGSSGANLPALEKHLGWDEFDFKAIGQAYLNMHPEDAPKSQSPSLFFALLRKSLVAWSQDLLEGPLPETWTCFEQRVLNALNFSKEQNDKETVLVVSSGGAISMALKHVMGFGDDTVINLNLQTRNTGISDIYFNERDSYLTSMNLVSHLDTPEKRDSITYA